MNDQYSEKLCAEKHKAMDEKIDGHEKWLSEHEKKIDNLDKSDAQKSEAISNLCKQLSGQTKALWGLVIAILGALSGFFIYVIETHIK